MITNPYINKLKRELTKDIGRTLGELAARISEPTPMMHVQDDKEIVENPEYFQEVDPPP